MGTFGDCIWSLLFDWGHVGTGAGVGIRDPGFGSDVDYRSVDTAHSDDAPGSLVGACGDGIIAALALDFDCRPLGSLDVRFWFGNGGLAAGSRKFSLMKAFLSDKYHLVLDAILQKDWLESSIACMKTFVCILQFVVPLLDGVMGSRADEVSQSRDVGRSGQKSRTLNLRSEGGDSVEISGVRGGSDSLLASLPTLRNSRSQEIADPAIVETATESPDNPDGVRPQIDPSPTPAATEEDRSGEREAEPAESTNENPQSQSTAELQSSYDEPDALESGAIEDDVTDQPGRRRGGSREKVRVLESVHIRAGESTRDVVVVLADVEVEGEVDGDLVVIGGSIRLQGNAVVQGDVVNIGSGVFLDLESEVAGDLVAIGGGVTGLTNQVKGELVQIRLADLSAQIGGFTLPPRIQRYLQDGPAKARPLTLKVGWIWWVWLGWTLFHGLFLILMPGSTAACRRELDRRPGMTLLAGLLMSMLILILVILLAALVLPVVLVPLLFLGVLVAVVIGKNGLLQFLGDRLTGRALTRAQLGPWTWCVGVLFLTAIYLLPVISLLVWLLFGLWALGAVTLAAIQGVQPTVSTHAASPTPTPVPMGQAPVSEPNPARESEAGISTSAPSMQPASTSVGEGDAPGPEESTTPPVQGPRIPPTDGALKSETSLALAQARIGVGRRLVASVIDLFVVSCLILLLPESLRGLRWLCAVLYFAGLWKLRGSTVGGLLLRIRVVRLDGRPLNLATAVVRSLGTFLAVLPFGVGYFWCAWDKERQAWHDMLAGTVVVRDPELRSLV